MAATVVAVTLLASACGGAIEGVDDGTGLGPDGGPLTPRNPVGRDAAADARRDGSTRRDASTLPDGDPPFVEPTCPDTPRPPPTVECDAFAPQGASGCPKGQGCFPFVQYPDGACDSEQYGAMCAPAGTGTQGTACDGATSCSAGFACVISGSGTQCVKLCELTKSGTCPDGFVCEPVDVPGYGACF